MSESDSRPDGSARDAPLHELPSLTLLLGQISDELTERGELGLLSMTVLRRDAVRADDSWDDYEAVLREVSVFLSQYTRRRMRPSDRLLDPIVAGNMLVMILGPPRDGRSLDQTDLTRVRHRLARGVKAQLTRQLPRASVERYGVFVGGTLVRHDRSVDPRRIIFHGLEESLADALKQRRRAAMRHAVQLQRILRNRQVDTVYQPMVDLSRQRVLGYEALTRLPRGQYPGPEVLFRVAHEHGALWAVERLCRERALENLPALDDDQLLFLNVEPDSFHDPCLCTNEFGRKLARSGLEPGRIVLEITEHAAVKDFDAMRRVLDEVRSFGFRLAMDDVGSGYAGLQTIAEIRPEYLKLDMNLVRDLHMQPIKRELVSTIRRFADATGTVLVAEGVERPEELETLFRVGVRCAQGFLLGRPESPPPVPDWSRLSQMFAAEKVF